MSGLCFQMHALPTVNPTWYLTISSQADQNKLCEVVFKRPNCAPFSGDVLRELEQANNWDHANVTFHGNLLTHTLITIHNMVQEMLRTEACNLMGECNIFYPQLTCKDAVAQVQSASPYNAIIMLIREIPKDTPWSLTKCIADSKSGFNWRRVTLEESWNIKVGFPIMLEALNRKIIEQTNSSLQITPQTLLLFLQAIIADDVELCRVLFKKYPVMLKAATELNETEFQTLFPNFMTNYFWTTYPSTQSPNVTSGLILEDTALTRALATECKLNEYIFWGEQTDSLNLATAKDFINSLETSKIHEANPLNVISWLKTQQIHQ